MRGIHAFAIVLAAGCAASPSTGGTEDGLQVVGQVIDFETGQAVSGSVSVSTTGLSPAPTVTISPPAFVLDHVTPNSVFYALAGADGHRSTYSTAIDVRDADVDLDVRVVSEAFLGKLSTAFGVTPTAANGVLIAQTIDATGHPKAGVPASAFAPLAGARGPYFLDANLAPAPAATATSASGWVVWFEVAPGATTISAASGAQYGLEMPTSPVGPAVATVAAITVADGASTLPKNVSFQNDVVPIFTKRGCQACHSGGGPGKDLANLTLDGSQNLIFKELMDTATTSQLYPRVDRTLPEKSLVLTMPSAESPADAHPNVTFTGPNDKDYLTILVWIREGAKQN
ncbi:MAG TPA: hypothetical protein VL463_01390 [Kofleriaceae bacterium]|jgi:hypothetical protein|nr:hypothetical protein [Kofleriaceae bacterium]